MALARKFIEEVAPLNLKSFLTWWCETTKATLLLCPSFVWYSDQKKVLENICDVSVEPKTGVTHPIVVFGSTAETTRVACNCAISKVESRCTILTHRHVELQSVNLNLPEMVHRFTRINYTLLAVFECWSPQHVAPQQISLASIIRYGLTLNKEVV